ncbi:Ig-like domain-containing protein [Microvirga sp. 2YAF29]|uniref:Ig-like domain-containing protein n=1 Tax=Microvirga sp. 2YAF29 TaxID=3233031 RepID=UPI003F99E7AC
MSDALLAAFNDPNATELTILDAIDTYAAELFFDGNETPFRALLDNSGRQKAVALGLKEVATLFGAYENIEAIQAELAHQIQVEYAKFEFIAAINAAKDADEMAAALYTYGAPLHEERMFLIEAWSESDKPSVVARVAALKSDTYTTVLQEIAIHAEDEAYMVALGERLLAAREATQDKRFYGDGAIMTSLDAGTDDIILDAFSDIFDAFDNEEATEIDILAVVDQYEDQLFSAPDLALFRQLPDNWGRQKAVVLGLKEVADLFDDYATLGALKAELAHQVKVEHDKYLFITAVDSAGDADAMAKALKDYVKVLSDERDALIAKWEKVEGNEDVAARVAALKEADYTTVLRQIETRLGQSPDFAEDIASLMLDARTAMGGAFVGDGKIVAALKIASAAINYVPTAPETRSVTTNEDVALVGIDIGARDVDGNDTLTYTIENGKGPQKGDVTFSGGKFTYIPDANVHGTDSFTIVISDGVNTIKQTVTVTVNSVNDAPTAPALALATVAENSANGTVVGDLSSTDIDTAALTYSLVDDAGGRFAVQGNKLVVKNGLLLDYEQAASHQVTVRVFDGTTNVDKILTVSLTDVVNETLKVSSGNNVLTGGIGNDKITGGTGKDIIGGGVGNDTLFGGKGKDIFVFGTKLDSKKNLDKITDFSVKDDSFWLDNAIFKKLGKGTEQKPGKLSKSFFSIDGAKDKNDYINYNSKTGVISYDADGLGGKKGIDFAKVKAGLAITEKDFFII